MSLSVIILAAGEGSRMHSSIPKVLHTVGGKTLLEHVITIAGQLDADHTCVVYGHGGEQVRTAHKHLDVDWVTQAEQLGTGHAVTQAMAAAAKHDTVLVLYGDVPLLTVTTLKRLIAAVDENSLCLLTTLLEDPGGYGRIIRDKAGRVMRIIEEKDASAEQRAIKEINTGIMAVQVKHLQKWLAKLDNQNAQGEYYLTDIIAMAVADSVAVNTVAPQSVIETLGVNTRAQLAEIERYYQQRQAMQLMSAGVTLRDPNRFDLRGEIVSGTDVTIDVNNVFEGKVILGDRVQIGPNNVIRNAAIGDDVIIHSHCVIDTATVGAQCRIGPYARIRPDTTLGNDVHIGNFVEIKKSRIEDKSKINHLSYIGDTTVGRNVNIGAGTITCNYDGANKHHTEIGDDVFIGSDTQLIAPVTVGKGATIGAGSTITRDVPPNELTLSRVPQASRKGWKRPIKKRSDD
jgi:bifunctional UDP-N-acetylglucosamine pyrophosphorylase / glucosamine-1-phosphate N-acetyltransferase